MEKTQTPAAPVIKTEDNTFRFSYLPLSLDFILRIVILESWSYGIISEAWFWVAHVLIGILIIVITFTRESKIQKKNQTNSTNIEHSRWSILFILSVIILSTFFSFSLHPDWALWLRILFALGSLILYSFYALVVETGSVQRISEAQRKKKSEDIPDDRKPIDKNDVDIIQMETRINSISNRIESFTLESALFGALAFSGFLTLIASEKPMLKNIQDFMDSLAVITGYLRVLDFDDLPNAFMSISSQDRLMGAIAIQTLTCSMVFVAVIVSRLRFYDMLKNLDYAVRVARTFNDKEEEAYNRLLESDSGDTSKAEGRLKELSKEVNDAIDQAIPLFEDLGFITLFIWTLRNLGIGTFVLILLTSAFLISQTLGVLSISLFILALVYAFFEIWVRNKKLRDKKFFQGIRKQIHRMQR